MFYILGFYSISTNCFRWLEYTANQSLSDPIKKVRPERLLKLQASEYIQISKRYFFDKDRWKARAYYLPKLPVGLEHTN